MHNFLLYLLKSTLCISLLYMLFRTIMRTENFFAMNRILLLIIVIASTIIPLLYLPKTYQPPVQVELLPVFVPVKTSTATLPTMETRVAGNISDQGNPIPAIKSPNLVFSVQQLLQYGYLAGFFVTLLFLVYSLIAILLLYWKARSIKMDGYRLLIIDREIAAFSFGRFVVLSRNDYEEHQQAMLAHEQAHIRLYHFFDLLLLETIRIFHWFNPFIHWLIRDMKEIHEFQADDYTITKGIDAIQYKLLIIQKGVGSQMFALANSFNHCQIKKRLVMMNKEKPSKAWSWKVATFLPLLALLLMAFGRKGENVPPNQSISQMEVLTNQKDSVKQWTEADFSKPDQLLKEFPKKAMLVIDILINSKSQIRALHENSSLKELAEYVRIFKDYDFSTEMTKPGFRKIVINGQERMGPIYILWIAKDVDALPAEYQKMLNVIGNTILEIRGKYSKKIFNSSYSKLTTKQREDIIKLVPAEAIFTKIPILASDVQKIPPPPPPPPPPFVSLPQDSTRTPLYVLDGIVTEKSIIDAVMHTGVEFITVLKGKSAIDTYGEKAKNGVVLITSKKKGIGANTSMSVIGYNTPQKNSDGIYVVAEQMPKFPGGEVALRKFITENVKYTAESQKAKDQGKVFVSFIVNSQGKVVNAKILKGINPSLDAEAIRIVNSLPDWIPGRVHGEAVDVSYTIPIPFGLQADTNASVANKNPVFLVVEEMPEFPGGTPAMRKFIDKHINYPSDAMKDKAKGEVVVAFVVRSDGKVENAKVIHGVHAALDAEAIRVVSMLPEWKPGKKDGKSVDVSCTVPINFALK